MSLQTDGVSEPVVRRILLGQRESKSLQEIRRLAGISNEWSGRHHTTWFGWHGGENVLNQASREPAHRPLEQHDRAYGVQDERPASQQLIQKLKVSGTAYINSIGMR